MRHPGALTIFATISIIMLAAALLLFGADAHAASILPAALPHPGDLLTGLGAAGSGAAGMSVLAFGVGATADAGNHAMKSKFFRVAVEGATTDGRNIERSWIEQMAKNFDPSKYGARIWMEHMRGMFPDGPFKAYGDVTAVKAEEVEIDGVKKLALFAQINPTDDLVAMTKARQKIYSSIEINPKFADTGEAYLVGLGVTDSPASLGTDVLAFAAQNPKANPFASRKTDPDNVFSVAVETTLEFEAEAQPEEGKLSKKVKEILAKFSAKKTNDDARFADVNEAVENLAAAVEEIAAQAGKTGQQFAAATEVETLRKQLTELQASFNTLKEQLDTEDGKQPQRPAATGAKGAQTDC